MEVGQQLNLKMDQANTINFSGQSMKIISGFGGSTMYTLALSDKDTIHL